MRFEGQLNLDLNEVTTNLVPYPRLHFLLAGMTPLGAATTAAAAASRQAGARSIDQARARGRGNMREHCGSAVPVLWKCRALRHCSCSPALLCHSSNVLHLPMPQAFLDVLSPAHQLVKVQPKQASPSTYGLLDRQCMSTCSAADVGAMLV